MLQYVPVGLSIVDLPPSPDRAASVDSSLTLSITCHRDSREICREKITAHKESFKISKKIAITKGNNAA